MPTIVFYVPRELKFGTLIGSFNKETIKEHEARLVNGRIPLQSTGMGENEMQLTLGCAKETIIADDADDDFDAILAEILAEEAAARESEEPAEAKKTKKKKKKKSGKKSEL